MTGSMHYGELLARAHHEHFGMVAEAAARELLDRLARGGMLSGTVVDLGCGGGVLSRRVAQAGFDVVGVDISRDMIALARAELPDADLRVGSLWDAQLPDCVAVAAVGEAFNYAVDQRAGLDALSDRVATIHAALAAGGVLMFDVAGPGRAGATGERRGHFERDDLVIDVVARERDGILVREIDVRAHATDRAVTETHALVLYPPAAIEVLLTDVGFTCERKQAWSDFPLLPGWTAFVATKR